MQSIFLPKEISLSIFSHPEKESVRFLKREGPHGSFIKKIGAYDLFKLNTPEGSRIFMSGVSSQQESVILSQLWKEVIGLSLGYRKRLRLVGIGFRGTTQPRPSSLTAFAGSKQKVTAIGISSANSFSKGKAASSASTQSKDILFPKYILRQENNKSKVNSVNDKTTSKVESNSLLVLKLGFSHDFGFPLNQVSKEGVKVDVSRVDGRTKGTVILVEGSNLNKVTATASAIQAYRFPDVYKGKGIHLDGLSITLKKGKRQG